MEIRVLGPLEVHGPNGPVTIASGKQRAILALLALNVGEVVGGQRLIDELWGESPPPTAGHAVQVHVSGLRQKLGADVLETRANGYRLRPDGITVDLARFEVLVTEALAASSAGNANIAAARFRDALAMWRGGALADLENEQAARAERTRLDELRELILERRIDADLACGRHLEVIPDLRRAIAESPLREGPYARLMVALYRSGRQAEALDIYHQARSILDSELGVEPGPELERVQRAVLAHDPALLGEELAASPDAPPDGSVSEDVRELIVTSFDDDGFVDALAPAIDLTGHGTRGLLLARLVTSTPGELTSAVADLRARRAAIEPTGVAVRTASFTTVSWGADLALLAARVSADLIIVGGVRPAPDGQLAHAIVELLTEAAVHVALVLPSPRPAQGGVVRSDAPILVPFGGTDHDWAALEFAAWLARGRDIQLIVAGMTSLTSKTGRPDASRLIADACLILQRMLKVDAEPLLVEPSAAALAAAAGSAGHVVLGLSDRWRDEGVGLFRMTVAASVPGVPIAIRRGLRPGGLAPQDALSRFTWSIAGQSAR
jgi:DNA-binding SARP family transcriptional activator